LESCVLRNDHDKTSLASVKRTFARPQALSPSGLRKRAKPKKMEYARRMRSSPTQSEELLWQLLRGRRCDGYRFRRQAVILGWIVDFYCPAARLVVEVDGPAHEDREAADARRDQVMASANLSILRIPADLVVNDPGLAVELVLDMLTRITDLPK
jgi:very-short-patch-repair endonuclease